TGEAAADENKFSGHQKILNRGLPGYHGYSNGDGCRASSSVFTATENRRALRCGIALWGNRARPYGVAGCVKLPSPGRSSRSEPPLPALLAVAVFDFGLPGS